MYDVAFRRLHYFKCHAPGFLCLFEHTAGEDKEDDLPSTALNQKTLFPVWS